MKHFLLFVAALSCSTYLYAADLFAELDREMAVYQQESADSDLLENEFKQYISAEEKQYQNWRAQYLKEFDQFQQELVAKWGEGDVSQKGRDVEFSEDKNVKSVVDYENEQLTVAVLVDKQLSAAEAQKIVKTKLQQLMADKKSNIAALFADKSAAEKGKISVFDVHYSDAKKQQLKELIIRQTQAQAQEIDKQADRAQLPESALTASESQLLATQEKEQLLKSSQARLNAAAADYEQAQKRAANDKKVVLYKVNLPENSLAGRAAKYVGFAEKESRIFHIPAALVMAIMHSESAFNPRAKSSVPAYGLMQIVPRTAGHDVNRVLRNIDKPMSKKDLYVPAINVETGTAYLNILDKRYLKAINHPRSRLYCTIAAYNTGAGNVARVFNRNGSRNINQAAGVINQLSPELVYQRLLAKLPYDETKHYLQRVNSRIALYKSKPAADTGGSVL